MTAHERRVAGDALQLAGLVRDHGPDTLHRLLDMWGPDHVRAVCIALAAAVDVDRTPQELWGWLGPVDNRTLRTVSDSADLWDGKGSTQADVGLGKTTAKAVTTVSTGVGSGVRHDRF
jgi:hypothetical protein